ncbi:LOW QUALITY PROTEIN: hypothetical protein HJFPF1_09057 [Paramyrothecium foliicola]|nr:LOW QUALITY PROTEIN: hypothetical protein HJFPF1_09057 [Paramyrothecium foliicola]
MKSLRDREKLIPPKVMTLVTAAAMTLAARESEQVEGFLQGLEVLRDDAEQKGFQRGIRFLNFKTKVIGLLKVRKRRRTLRRSRDTACIFTDPTLSWISLPSLPWLELDDEDDDNLKRAPTIQGFVAIIRDLVNLQAAKQKQTGNHESVDVDSACAEDKYQGADEHDIEMNNITVKEQNEVMDRNAASLKRSRERQDSLPSDMTKRHKPTPQDYANMHIINSISNQAGGEAIRRNASEMAMVIGQGPSLERVHNCDSSSLFSESRFELQDDEPSNVKVQVHRTGRSAYAGSAEKNRVISLSSEGLDAVDTRDGSDGTSNPSTPVIASSGTLTRTQTPVSAPTQDIPSSESRHLKSIKIIRGKVEEMGESFFEVQKVQLLEGLQDLEEKSMPPPEIKPHVDNQDYLNASFGILWKQLHRMPAANFNKYKEELVRPANAARLMRLNYKQRLYAICQVVYLPEELEAANQLDWDRLREAATMCGFLSEVTGPLEEEVDGDWMTEWVEFKMREIRWLKKFFEAQHRYLRPGAFSAERGTKFPWATEILWILTHSHIPMPARKRAPAEAIEAVEPRRRSGRISSTPQKSKYFEDSDGDSDRELPPKKRRVSKKSAAADDDSEDQYQDEPVEEEEDDDDDDDAGEQDSKKEEGEDDDEDEDDEDAPRRVKVLPLEKLRDDGGVEYEDHKVHRNTLLFLKDLKANNKRPWLKSHDGEYRRALKDWDSFVVATTQTLIDVDETIPELPTKDVIFRIHRDIRFSKDPTPYKPHFSAAWSRTGRKGPYACYYIHCEPGGSSFVGGGLWCPEKGHVDKLRRSIDRHPRRWRQALDDPLLKAAFFPTIKRGAGPEAVIKAFVEKNKEYALKKRPMNYEATHRDIALLRLKSYTIGTKIDDKMLCADDAQEKITTIMRALSGFVTFLNNVVMPDPNADESDSEDEDEEEGEDANDED